VKQGQIAHLDQNPANSTAESLAFLCLRHHDQYDTRTSQSKGLTIQEVKAYRTELHQAMESFRAMRREGLLVEELEQFISEQRAWQDKIARKVDSLMSELQKFQTDLEKQIQRLLAEE
jgi:FtsZ-binding cell division protein ZapB